MCRIPANVLTCSEVPDVPHSCGCMRLQVDKGAHQVHLLQVKGDPTGPPLTGGKPFARQLEQLAESELLSGSELFR